MKRTRILILLTLLALFHTGCVKEVYNLDKLSDRMKLSPVFAFPAAKGDLTLSDIVKPDDTVRFDNDNFIRIVLKKDSVFDLRLKDFYNFSDIASLDRGYVFGEVEFSDFTAGKSITLNTISLNFTPALRATFLSLDDGNPHDFPSFPSTNTGEHSFGPFAGFENALLSSGMLKIKVKNNLTAPLNDIKVHVYNSPDHSEVTPEVTIPSLLPGESDSISVNIAGRSIRNNMVAAIVFTGSPGASNVIVDMDQTVDVSLHGYDLEAVSGRLIVPEQVLGSPSGKDTIDLDPGTDIEIESGKILTGSLAFTAISGSPLNTTIKITLPSTSRSGTPVQENIIIPPLQTVNGSVSLNNTTADFSTDVNKPYNRLPVNYEIKVSSGGNMINFSSLDEVQLKLTMPDPDIDYLKGYFGQKTEEIEKDTIFTELDDILEKITGSFHIANPSIKLNYSNSFGIPVGITFEARGRRDATAVNLDLAPFTIDYPAFPVRDITSSFKIDKTNSKLADIVSLPPTEVSFSGSGKLNPSAPSGTRNNYVFGNSRFIASLEIEVPLELWINNLQFADTVDNFLKSDSEDDDSPLKPENMEFFRLKITASNGFPLGASLKVILYDSLTATNLHTINAPDIIKPALVDASGKVTSAVESETIIDFDKDFFSKSSQADKMIFVFTLVTSGGGTKDVKFYSDYKLNFKANLLVKPNLIF